MESRRRSFERTLTLREAIGLRVGNLRAAMIIARNSVPVIGVLFLGWSTSLVILGYWWESVSYLLSLIVVNMPGEMRGEKWHADLEKIGGLMFFVMAMHFVVGALLLGIPFWFFIIVILATPLIDVNQVAHAFGEPTVLAGFLLIALLNLLSVLRCGYHLKTAEEVRPSLHWEFLVLTARASAMCLLIFFVPAGLVLLTAIAIAIALTVIDLYPLKALAFLGMPVDESVVPPEEDGES